MAIKEHLGERDKSPIGIKQIYGADDGYKGAA